MPLRKLKSLNNSSRHTVISDYSEITKRDPEKRLVKGFKKNSGRNNLGRITVRHKGGGHKKLYRFINFKGIPGKAKVISIEYDPNRTSRIALIQYPNGIKNYIIAPAGLSVGTIIEIGENAEAKIGNRLPLKNIPEGTEICNIEIQPGKGGQLIRSAGSSAILMAKMEKYANVKLPSGEIRLFPFECMATIGKISNPEYKYISLGKAGRKRWKGIRPTVRGVAMNPIDHPMGGGEGRGKGNIPVTPWGQPTKGFKTRKKIKYSDKFILQRRKK